MAEKNNSTLVGITEITTHYLPVSKRKARKFVSLYMEPKRIGNRIFVDRKELENLLSNPNRERFPLNLQEYRYGSSVNDTPNGAALYYTAM